MIPPFSKQSHFVRFIKTNSTVQVWLSMDLAGWPSGPSSPGARGKETLTTFSRMAALRSVRRAAAALKRSFDHQRQWRVESGHGTESIIATNFTLQIYIDSGIRGGAGDESNQMELDR